jgi:putative ABC transport system permease protein
MAALNRKLIRDLLHMRGQVFAVTLVVACGIATYVTMRSAYQSLLVARSEYYSAYRFADVFAHLKRAPESLTAQIAAIPGVAAIETRVVMDVSLDIPGLNEPATGRLISIPDRRRPMLNDLFLRAGRYPEPGRRGEVLMSEAFAAANHLRVGGSLSAVMNGKWEKLQIVGTALSPEYVYEVRPGEVFPDNRRFGVLWMSRDVMGPAFNMEGGFNDVALSLAHGANEPEVIARLDPLLERYGSLGAYGRSDQISARFLTDELAEIRTSGLILPTLFLAIVAFLLHVLLSRLVSTQRSQIAVLKAFGYRSTEIGFHYLKLALVAVTAGTIAGVGLGLWLGSGLMARYAEFFHFPQLRLEIDPRVILLAAGISAGSACLGAISAVRKAVSLAPAEAMRPEPPAQFRPGFFERIGLGMLLSPASRMIVRNLERRRWRAFLSALAVALAVAMLVVGRYTIDAVDRLVAIQFHTLQREDVTVGFYEPRPANVRFELAQLPGVLRVEPFREVPVRLRFGHRSRRVGLLGLTNSGELRRPLDQNLKRIDLPPDGLLLNSKLAEILGAHAGDMVTVEVLEGARPVRQIPVMQLVDEPIGLTAYMQVDALHRLMREGGTISGAYLKVDPALASTLYSLLKNTPAVSGVAVREAMLASFWQTFGESMGTTTTILVAFACVIAFGIVYNGARIALSERGNELASLRVLGYTRVEIGRILLGEQGLLTLLAIPAGFLLGLGFSWLISRALSRELFRLPFVINAGTYGFAAVVVGIAAVLSGLVVARRLQRMDLTAVLKSRE